MAEKDIIIKELVKRVNSNIRRIRSLEERVESLETKLLSVETTANKRYEELKEGLLALKSKIGDFERRFEKIEKSLERLQEKMKNVAYKIDVKQLERIMELLDPVRNEFVTREEVRRMIGEE